MPAPRGADIREAEGRLTAGFVGDRAFAADVYLTNEVFLYRVVGLVDGAAEMVELEDCYWLDVVRVPARDLRARRLRVVTPAPAES